MGWSSKCATGARLAAAIGLAAALAAAMPATAERWDPRDVAAADGYRAAERERADRYRAEISRDVPEAGKPTRTAAPPPPHRERTESRLFGRVLGALLAEFDLEAITTAWERARSAWIWWEDEARPRAARVLELASRWLDAEGR